MNRAALFGAAVALATASAGVAVAAPSASGVTHRNVHVCALCPGFTYSEFHDVTGTRAIVSKMPKWMWLSAGEVARQGIDAVERGEAVWVTGRVNRAIKALVKLLPDRLALRLVRGRSKHFRAQ